MNPPSRMTALLLCVALGACGLEMRDDWPVRYEPGWAMVDKLGKHFPDAYVDRMLEAFKLYAGNILFGGGTGWRHEAEDVFAGADSEPGVGDAAGLSVERRRSLVLRSVAAAAGPRVTEEFAVFADPGGLGLHVPVHRRVVYHPPAAMQTALRRMNQTVGPEYTRLVIIAFMARAGEEGTVGDVAQRFAELEQYGPPPGAAPGYNKLNRWHLVQRTVCHPPPR